MGLPPKLCLVYLAEYTGWQHLQGFFRSKVFPACQESSLRPSPCKRVYTVTLQGLPLPPLKAEGTNQACHTEAHIPPRPPSCELLPLQWCHGAQGITLSAAVFSLHLITLQQRIIPLGCIQPSQRLNQEIKGQGMLLKPMRGKSDLPGHNTSLWGKCLQGGREEQPHTVWSWRSSHPALLKHMQKETAT